MHPMYKGACGLFFVLLIHIFEVHGWIFGLPRVQTNGLELDGLHVCRNTKSKSVLKSEKVPVVSFTQYTTSCGVLGLSRCRRLRTVTGYRYRQSYKTGYDTYLSCCSGWRRSHHGGKTCPIPICSYGCNNGGTCVSPNTCSCSYGWKGSTCSIDIDECSSNNGGCAQRCINRRGAARICGCYKGYKKDPYDSRKCIDVNECRAGRACSCSRGASCGANCTNTNGGFYCSCGKGYMLQGGTVCTDINECSENNGDCSRQCVNFPGGFRCTCPRGFRLVSSKSCKDVDECASNNGNCEHTCRNLFGSHQCKCNDGFMLNSNGRTCSDIDESKLGHDCEDHCSNTFGGYFCSCRKGYQVRNDNKTCTDINECAPRNLTGSNETATLSACHHICTNVEGSFQCSCRKGYALMYDKKQCEDIDECQTGNHFCEHNCHNTDGSYSCTCKAGYKLTPDGKTCKAQPCEKIDPPWQGRMTCSGMVTDTNCTFFCNPGFDLVGSNSRTCLPSSSWSGDQTLCKAKHCKKLTTTLESETLSVPCFISLGSTCYFGCRRGFLLKGDGQANCSLNSKGDAVSWNIGQFSCEEITTCQPNPCRHEGKCLALDENRFICDCEGTGYKGNQCEIGFITTPLFPKLRLNSSSKALPILARPSKRLKVSLNSEEGVKFDPLSVEIKFPERKGAFTAKAAMPGIGAVTYFLEGENKDDFETPERGALFAAPEIFNNGTTPFLLKGELTVGCEEQKTKKNFSCELRLLSTAPWAGTSPSTNGIVHFATVSNQTIPLSLIGLNLSELHISRNKMIEIGIAKTSAFKKFSLLYQRNGKCYSKVADSNNLLELINNDAFVSSFMYALSAMAPEWLTLAVSETNEYFDIQNIAVTLAPDLEHCSGFPFQRSSTLAYYRPAVSYKMRIAQSEVLLLADGRTCFAINVCKPGLFINVPKRQAELLKSTLNVFRDMKDCCGIDLIVDSIGFLDNEETSHFVRGVIWNGMNLQKLPAFDYNAWLKGNLDWRMEIPKLLNVTFKMTGETIINSKNIDSLFTDRMSQRIEMQLRGKGSVKITGRALKKDFSLKLDSPTINGKAVLGGRTTCRKNVQGIFVTLETSVSNLLNKSPLSTYILPIANEPVRLAILMALSGGRQNKIVNIRQVKRFLTDLSSLIPKVKEVLHKANSILPEVKVIIEEALEMTQQLNYLMQEIEMVNGERMDVTRVPTFLNHINSKVEYLKKVINLITPMTFSSNDFSLLRTIFQIQPVNFPKPLPAILGGELVETSLQGISFYLRTKLCIGQFCFNNLSTTVDFIAERSCFINASYFSTFLAKGKVPKTIPLSGGDILTLSEGQIINLVFPRDSDAVSAYLVGEIRLFGIKQSINVELDNEQLSFQMQGEIFDKYMTNMKVTAKSNHDMDWSSLIFTVEGKMMNYSLLSQSLQIRVINFAKYLAQKAAKRVETCKESILLAEQRLASVTKMVEDKQSIFNEALRENQRKHSEFQRISKAYDKASLQLNSSLTQFLKVRNKKLCELQSCSYINTDACIPTVCQKELIVNYPVPKCRKVNETLNVQVVVSKVEEEVEWVPSSIVEQRSDCGKTGKGLTTIGGIFSTFRALTKRRRRSFSNPASFVSTAVGGISSTAGKVVSTAVGTVSNIFGRTSNSIFGCDDYKVMKPGTEMPVKHYVTKNYLETKTVQIDRYICDKEETKSVISGYDRPYECCKSEVSVDIKVLDPNCVSHNSQCLRNMTVLAEEIEFFNDTLFGEFQTMTNKGKLATVAQLEANKAKVKFDVAAKQLELARALLKQHRFAKESVNLTTVRLREKLGLKFSGEINSLEDKALVSVDGLAFSVSMTRSSTKTRFPLTAYVRTFKDSEKAIQFSMDFENVNNSLALASRLIVETLFGTSRSRRRRSVRQEVVVSKINGSSFPLEHQDCLFSQEAHVFFADIVESLEFTIKSKNELKEATSAGIRGLEKLPNIENSACENTSGPWQEIRASFSDTIQTLKDVQFNSSETISWNSTLDDVRAFLDVLTQEKNFTECSGIQDCTDFFFDSLEEMYEMEYHSRAIEIKAMLQSLKKIISSMLKENHEMSALEDMISQAKLLINSSSDDVILCGNKPAVERSSPVHVIAMIGETVNLVCEAKSTLEVEYLWIKNDQPLEETNSAILELQNVTKQSEGAYKCQVSNRRGSTVSNVTIVEVHQRPNITEHPADAQGLVGDEIILVVCNSTGIPRPVTEWFFIPLKGEKHEAVRVNTTVPVLRMSNLTTANAGFYYCNVSNLHGTVQSKFARLDVLRFVPGVPRIAVSLKLKQCISAASPENKKAHCKVNGSKNFQQVDSWAFENITRKMLERANWPMERVNNKHHNLFPTASVSFVVNGGNIFIPEGKKLEALYSFSQSRRLLGNDLKKLYFALQDEGMKFKWKNLTITGDAESLAFGFLPQGCPNGTRRHENGFLCVYCLPGYYGVPNGTCLKCPVGTYQPDEGRTECVKCPFRVSYTGPGSVWESQCIAISIPCKPPKIAPKYAQAAKELKNLYRSGETIVFGCEPGYRVVGNGSQVCNEGNWTAIDYYCEKTCFPPWTELKKRCYLVTESPSHRWTDAFHECQKLTSHMVTISSEEENEFTGQLAKAYVDEKKLGQVRMWLGLGRLQANGPFRWVDWSPLEGYTNWAPGEPNNGDGRELCSEMLVSAKYWLNKWNNVHCDGSGYKPITVCEKPLREGD